MANTIDSQSGDRITLTEAARTVGKAATTIRRLVDLGALTTIRDETGRHWVNRQDVINHYAVQAHSANSRPPVADRSSRSGATADTSPTVGSATLAEISRLTATVDGQNAQIALLHDMLARERASIEDLKKQVAALERDRTQHLAEMRALLSGKKEGLLSIKRWIG